MNKIINVAEPEQTSSNNQHNSNSYVEKNLHPKESSQIPIRSDAVAKYVHLKEETVSESVNTDSFNIHRYRSTATPIINTTPPTSHKINNRSSDTSVHIVFSTDCSFYQDWQTLLIYHSANQVKQEGFITRIASGCDQRKQDELIQLYLKLGMTSITSEKSKKLQFFIHFTPDFKLDKKSNTKYDFYNKPYGVKHWLEFSVHPIPNGTIIALIDPDFIFLRPLTTEIIGQKNNLFLRKELG
jgi:hypothetical protein